MNFVAIEIHFILVFHFRMRKINNKPSSRHVVYGIALDIVHDKSSVNKNDSMVFINKKRGQAPLNF
jgi:hypothetical protein